MTTTAAAASLTPAALPAVTVPSFLKAGLSLAKRLARRCRVGRARRRLNSTFSRLALDSDGDDLVVERPPSIAACARRCDSKEKSSCASRETECDSARFSAVMPMWMSSKGSVRLPTTASISAHVAHAGAPARARHPVRAAAHRLGPAREGDVGVSGLDRLRGRDDRLHAAAAQAVDRQRRRLLRHAGLDPDHAGHVHVLRGGVDHVSEHDLVDLRPLPGRRAPARRAQRSRRDRWAVRRAGSCRRRPLQSGPPS